LVGLFLANFLIIVGLTRYKPAGGSHLQFAAFTNSVEQSGMCVSLLRRHHDRAAIEEAFTKKQSADWLFKMISIREAI